LLNADQEIGFASGVLIAQHLVAGRMPKRSKNRAPADAIAAHIIEPGGSARRLAHDGQR